MSQDSEDLSVAMLGAIVLLGVAMLVASAFRKVFSKLFAKPTCQNCGAQLVVLEKWHDVDGAVYERRGCEGCST